MCPVRIAVSLPDRADRAVHLRTMLMTDAFNRWRAAMARTWAAAPSLNLLASYRGRLLLCCGRFRELGKPAANENSDPQIIAKAKE